MKRIIIIVFNLEYLEIRIKLKEIKADFKEKVNMAIYFEEIAIFKHSHVVVKDS